MNDQKAAKVNRSAESNLTARGIEVFFRPWEMFGFGASLTHAMLPPASVGLEMFKEWRELARAGADVIELNMHATADGLQQIAQRKTPAELGEATTEVTRSLASLWVRTNQKLAGLAIEYASARAEKTGKLVISTLRRADG